MNDNVKKVGLIVIVIVALIAVGYQAFRVAAGPVEVKHEIGHGTPGHGMKAAENEEAAGKSGTSSPPKPDPLGG